MIIILRRIPADTKKHEITDFLLPALKGGIFRKSGKIVDVKIVVLRDVMINSYEFHGLVEIDSDTVAKRVIKKLNRKVFNGKHIAVREYFERSWHNDPRINNENQKMPDRRKGDRRRRLEVVKDISKQFSSNKAFHRTL